MGARWVGWTIGGPAAPLPTRSPIDDTSLLGLRLRRFPIKSASFNSAIFAGQSLLLRGAACQALQKSYQRSAVSFQPGKWLFLEAER
jgi:hypothetical protein